MYLLQMDSGNLLALIIFGFIINCFIMYLIIKIAVKSGTREVKDQIRLSNNLKITEMLKNGYTIEEITKLRDETLESK